MSSRGQATPPFNSPYQQHVQSTTLLHSPAYPSPARSDSDATRYPTDGLGLYSYSQSFNTTGPPTSSVLYTPSPQSTESWAHLSSGPSPLMTEALVDPWTSGAYDHPVSRSPMPWDSHDDDSHRSSLSSTRELSIFSHVSSEHKFPQIKLESGSEWTNGGERHAPTTVAPERLHSTIFPYDHSFNPPQLPPPRFEGSLQAMYEPRESDQMSYGRSRSSDAMSSPSSNTARTRVRRNFATPENFKFSCHVCHKLFQRSYNHKTHMQIHDANRKKEHVCPFRDCGREFVRKTDLARHRKSVHDKIKDFQCSKCGASHFSRKDTLRRHEEDGCSKRHELTNANFTSRSMRRGPVPQMQYYHSPRSDIYDSRSPELFQGESFPGSPNSF